MDDHDPLERISRPPPVDIRSQTALWFEGRSTSFEQLDALSAQCARALIAAGLPAGARIAALTRNSDLFVILMLGAMKARVCLTPINARLAPPEIVHVLNDSGARALFFSDELALLVDGFCAKAGSVELVVQFEPGHPTHIDLAAFIAGHSADSLASDVHARDPMIQLYTSGTTGFPKGVPLTRRNYRSFLRTSIAAGWARWEAGKTVLLASPLFHVAGINVALIALSQGVRAVIVREVNVEQIMAIIPQMRVAYAFLAPTIVNMMLQEPGIETADFSSLEKICYGASAITEELLKAAIARFGCEFTQLYGMTETSGGGVQLPHAAHAGKRLRSCGRPIAGVELRIAGGQGEALAPGEVGEIEIRSDIVMEGYWNLPEANALSFREGSWFRTGDAGYLDDEGFLYIRDRVKDMIISGGENIYPAEVENAIFGHPAVADVAVVAAPDPKWGETAKAIIVLKPGAEPDPTSIIAWARERIAGYKIPRSIEFIDELPRNPSGKVLRRELRERFWIGHDRRVG